MVLHLPYKLLLVSVVYSIVVAYFLGHISSIRLVFSITVAILALVLGLWTKNVIIKNKTTLNPSGKPTNLITKPPFNFSRNPMYISYVVMALGAAVFSGHWLGFIGPILYFLYLNFWIIPREEKNLSLLFSESYLIYKNKVRRWL